jgi:hypothetical protein
MRRKFDRPAFVRDHTYVQLETVCARVKVGLSTLAYKRAAHLRCFHRG